MQLRKLIEFFLDRDKEKHSHGAGTEVISRRALWSPDCRRLFSAHCKSRKYYRSLFPSSGICTKNISESKLLLPQGSDPFSCTGKALALLLRALSSRIEVTYPHTAAGVGGISSWQFSQDEHGRHDTLSWMRFACRSL